MTATSRLSIQKWPRWRAQKTRTHTITQIHTGAHNRMHTFNNTHQHLQGYVQTHWKVAKCIHTNSHIVLHNIPKYTHTLGTLTHTHTHTQDTYSHPGNGRVNMHIDHLLIYRNSKHCKQRHGFFCFHKTQFIHLFRGKSMQHPGCRTHCSHIQYKHGQGLLFKHTLKLEKSGPCFVNDMGPRFIYTARNS